MKVHLCFHTLETVSELCMPEFEEGMHYQAAESLILILFFFSLIKKTRVHRYDKTKYSYLLHNGLCIYSISGVLLIFLPAICQLRTGLLIIYSSLIPILYRPIVSFFQPQLFFSLNQLLFPQGIEASKLSNYLCMTVIFSLQALKTLQVVCITH